MPISLDETLHGILGQRLRLCLVGEGIDSLSEEMSGFLHFLVSVGRNISKKDIVDLPCLGILKPVEEDPQNAEDIRYCT